MVYYKKWIVVITATTLVYALNGWHALEVIQLHSGRFGLKDKYLYINLMPNLKSCKVWACVKTSICWFLYPFTKTEAHPAESATHWKLKSDGEVGVKGSLCLTQHESNLNTVCFCSFFSTVRCSSDFISCVLTPTPQTDVCFPPVTSHSCTVTQWPTLSPVSGAKLGRWLHSASPICMQLQPILTRSLYNKQSAA